MKKPNRLPSTPCPDPQLYILVQTKEKSYWRRKRGTLTPATLNDSFKKNAENIQRVAPVSKRIVSALHSFLQSLDTGRLIARLNGRLVEGLNKKGSLDYTALKDFDFQPRFPLTRILATQIRVSQTKNQLHITIEGGIDRLVIGKSLVTDYYFETILLSGDPSDVNTLEIESVTSPLYPITIENHPETVLPLPIPAHGIPWMAMLKVNSHEGNQLAYHCKYYGMKVVETS